MDEDIKKKLPRRCNFICMKYLHSTYCSKHSDFTLTCNILQFLLVEETVILLLFDDNKLKMARKPGKKQKENTVGCTGKGKR